VSQLKAMCCVTPGAAGFTGLPAWDTPNSVGMSFTAGANTKATEQLGESSMNAWK